MQDALGVETELSGRGLISMTVRVWLSKTRAVCVAKKLIGVSGAKREPFAPQKSQEATAKFLEIFSALVLAFALLAGRLEEFTL